ncbi:MAG: c-type cytochrome domain-containing protein [Verrucomicrobiota bacterium]
MSQPSRNHLISPIICLVFGILFLLWPLGFESGEEASSPWITFFAAFHPLILHLPIGIIFAVAVYEIWAVFNPGSHNLRRLLWIAAATTASLSFATGYFLGEETSTSDPALELHLWTAGVFTAFCWIALAATLRNPSATLPRFLLGINIVSMSVAGHYGGLMVHGDPFARAPWADDAEAPAAEVKIVSEDIYVFRDLIDPLMQAKCVACHGEKKKKGKLRLDSFDMIMAGGGDGECLVPGSSYDSLMIELMEYPIDDEDRMPPEDEPQFTDFELATLKWWIDEGAAEDHVIAKSDAPDFVKPMLAPDYQILPDQPEEPVQ